MLLSGAIAAPHPEEPNADGAVAPEWVTAQNLSKLYRTQNTDQSSFHREKESITKEISQQASQAGVKVLIDILDGKDLQEAILDR